MQPSPNVYTTFEKVERWFRRRRNLKRLALDHLATVTAAPHPIAWITSEPVPWAVHILDGQKEWTCNLTLAKQYVRLRYGRELRPGEVRTLKKEWGELRLHWLRRNR